MELEKDLRKSLWYTTDMFLSRCLERLHFTMQMRTVFEPQSEMTMYEIVAHSRIRREADQIQ